MDNTQRSGTKLYSEIAELRQRVSELEKAEQKHKLTENKLFDSQKMLQLVMDTIPQRIFWKDRNYAYLGCNKQFAKDAGLKDPNEIIGKSDYDLSWKDIAHLYREDDKFVMDNDSPKYSYEEPQILSDGTQIWVRTTKVPLHDRNGNVIGLMGSYEDITEKRKSEALVQQERKLLRTLIDNLPDLIYVKDVACRKTIANKADVANMGLESEEQVVGKNDFDFYPRETAEKFFADDQSIIQTGQPVIDREEDFIDPKGEKKWLLTTKIPLRNDQGGIIGVMGIGRDITARKTAEEHLLETTKKLQMIFENAFDGISIFEENYEPGKRRLIECNERYAEMAGFSREELLRIGDLENAGLTKNLTENNAHYIDIGVGFKGCFTWKRPDGKDNIIEYNAVPIKINGKTLTIGIDRDVTQQRHMEGVLQDERNLFRTLIDNLPDLVYFKDAQGRYLLNNREHLRSLGLEKQEDALGKTVFDFHSKELAQRYFEDEMKVVESAEPLIDKEEAAIHHDTGRECWHLTSKIPLWKDGKVTGILCVSRDITTRKQSEEAIKRVNDELERKNLDLSKANKVKSQFLANMSHEIRTPLNAVIGMTGLLLDTHLNEEQRDYAETILNSGDILLSLINDILDFSKIEAQKIELEKQPLDVRLCIEEALDLVAPKAVEKSLELAYSIDESISSKIIGDVTRLRQILVNLLSNAIKFTSEGEVVITVSGQLRDHYAYQLHFAVRDTGLGIPVDLQKNLFQSFTQVDASTTRKFGGTGLGLAISKQLCELMGGTMWVESSGKQGEGSTFHFTIITELSVEKQIVKDMSALSGKRILIVDDNKTNREILQQQTKSLNMLPVGAMSGPAAIELFNQGAIFDLAILDYHMPEMDGLMLAGEIRKLKNGKELPLILLSSFGYRERTDDFSMFSATLTKPIKSSQLHSALLTVLKKNGTSPAKKPEYIPLQYDMEIGKQHPLRVLLAEDNTINQKVALRSLEKIGYRADIAFNGLEVLEAMKRQVYDIVLMDIQMPEMDGVQATMQIRKEWPQEQQPRIIAVTANAVKEDHDKYLTIGVNDYLIKPFKMEDLVRVLLETQPLSNKGSEVST